MPEQDFSFSFSFFFFFFILSGNQGIKAVFFWWKIKMRCPGLPGHAAATVTKAYGCNEMPKLGPVFD